MNRTSGHGCRDEFPERSAVHIVTVHRVVGRDGIDREERGDGGVHHGDERVEPDELFARGHHAKRFYVGCDLGQHHDPRSSEDLGEPQSADGA
jgi:hypothetical protein